MAENLCASPEPLTSREEVIAAVDCAVGSRAGGPSVSRR